MSRVLVLAGGSPHAHDFVATGAALTELCTDLGHTARSIDDPDAAAAILASPPDAPDALVVDGLWWRMLGEVYDPWRADHSYSTPPNTRDALSSFVRRGGGLLAVHTSPICFDDWPEWGDVVGGAWQWGVSSHPPAGPVRARVVAEHPVTAGLPCEIELVDEVYGDMSLRDDVEVLAVARRDPGDDEQPVVWTHRYGAGRVVFDGFGHDVASIHDPTHARLLAQALAWVLEAD
jgi:hypothetical protein